MPSSLGQLVSSLLPYPIISSLPLLNVPLFPSVDVASETKKTISTVAICLHAKAQLYIGKEEGGFSDSTDWSG